MFANSVSARKLLGSLGQIQESPAPKKGKKAPVDDYPYETDSSGSEGESEFEKEIEKPKKKMQTKKTVSKKVVPVELPQPAPPAPVSIAVAAPKEKKVRAKKIAEVPVVAAPVVAQGTPLEVPAKSAKVKRAPSKYNVFASARMREGMSMKDVAAAWKAEKEKAAK